MNSLEKKAGAWIVAAVLAGTGGLAIAADGAASAAAEAAASAPAAAAVGAVAGSAAPAVVAAATQQPRSFGHVLGDVLTQRVLLEQAGRAVEPSALPAADRVGLYLERRTPRVERDELGRRWLVIDYQVINAPRVLIATALPALAIATRSGSGTPLSVAAWPISIGPLTPPATFGQGDLLPLRPDRAVEPLATAGVERQLKTSLAGLVAVLLIWAAWWAGRNWREAQRLPFARAWREVRRLDEASPQAWRAVHHALNATCGRAVHGATLPRLLADAPHLRPLATRLDAFFRHSAERFFAAGSSAPAFPLRELSQALRDVERQHKG